MIDMNAIESTFLELQVLKNADHQFLTKIQYFYSTPARFYFVMPFVGGGELSLVLKQAKTFDEKQIKFYII